MMPDAAFIHDADGRLVFFNKAYQSLSGLSEGDAIGKFYWDVFPKIGGSLPHCGTSETMHSKHVSRDEFVIGEKAYLSFGYSPGKFDGHNTDSLHVLHEITESKKVHEKLSGIASHFSLLYALSPDAIMLLDENGFFDCNPAALRIFGCSERNEFIGKHPSQFSPATQSDGRDSMVAAAEKIAEAMKNGSNLFEWMHCRLDGSIFPAEVLLVSFEKDGKTVLQATVRNITRRKNAENQIALDVVRLSSALAGLIATMSKAMELRDPYTAGHQTRVAEISCQIAKELGWAEERIQGLRMAALVHDIGKIAIPAEILTKPSRLSEFEEKLMQEHANHGYTLLKDIDFPWPIADIVHQHHERLDGSGYPQHLKADAIMPEARVLAVADTIEAMATHRPYRPALGLPAAIEEINKQAGITLDKDVVNAAVRLFEGKTSLEGA